MATPTQKKTALRQILEKGVAQVLNEAQVPHHVHMRVVKALRTAMDKSKADRDDYRDVYKRHKLDLDVHEARDKEHEEHLTAIIGEAQRLAEIAKGEDGKEGIPGKDGKDAEVDVPALISAILSRVPAPKDGLEGKPGKDGVSPEVDEILTALIKRIQKGGVIHANHVSGIGSFVKDGVRYRFEELMHGAGKASSGGFSIIIVSGTINDSNTSFVAASTPTLLNINGAFYQKTGGAITWSLSGLTITLSSPVGQGGSIFAI